MRRGIYHDTYHFRSPKSKRPRSSSTTPPTGSKVRDAILSLDSAIYDLSKALAELDDRDVPEAVSDLARSLHHDVEDLRWEFDSHDFRDQVKELAEQAGENDAAADLVTSRGCPPTEQRPFRFQGNRPS